MKELKPTTLLFYLSPTCICHGIRYWFRDELNLVKNTVGNFDICWCLFGNILPKALREKNRLHEKIVYY
jgi:hypothetical protein